MKLIGILTRDFAVYYDLVKALRERGIPFASLVEGAEVPPNIGVVLTTAAEAPRIPHPRVITYSTTADTLEAALRALTGKDRYRRVTVGIDPGERPGIAVLGDGQVLATRHADRPEAVPELVARLLSDLSYETVRVRIGHGAPSMRDRIINGLVGLALPLELVDETSTTPLNPKTPSERDIHAAQAIALARGIPLAGEREVVPSEGELRDIQRKSRLASEGEVTISRQLARLVARGEVTLAEAVDWQRRSRE